MTMRAAFMGSSAPRLRHSIHDNAGPDARTGTCGLDGERAAYLTHTLPHSRQPHTQDRSPTCVIAQGNAAPTVLHFEIHRIPVALQFQGNPRARRMALRVG